ncbi:Uncharacterised protein [Starkeya nomas]|uniref:Uncharacterized protein n=1 Tax=Starkeya nomas TaxID=2666134 RepID=A0A5S9Q111_9HYPH|nr:Uncharacterised protein [Starkeya nomas]
MSADNMYAGPKSTLAYALSGVFWGVRWGIPQGSGCHAARHWKPFALARRASLSPIRFDNVRSAFSLNFWKRASLKCSPSTVVSVPIFRLRHTTVGRPDTMPHAPWPMRLRSSRSSLRSSHNRLGTFHPSASSWPCNSLQWSAACFLAVLRLCSPRSPLTSQISSTSWFSRCPWRVRASAIEIFRPSGMLALYGFVVIAADCPFLARRAPNRSLI